MFDLTYKGKRASEVGMLVKVRPSIPAPELEYDPIEIPGRDGILMPTEKRYLPLEIEVEFNFMSETPNTWNDTFRKAKAWLSGQGELTFSDDADVFYKVYNVRIEDSERTSRRIGAFMARFICDPYTYLKSGAIERDPDECLYNAYEIAHPIYHMVDAGSWTLSVNYAEFSGTGETFIDTDLMVAYDEDGVVVNTTTLGDFADLYLYEGENDIQADVDFYVQPNWRTL